MGSIPAARRAGKYPATVVTVTIIVAAARIVHGSVGVTPYSIDFT